MHKYLLLLLILTTGVAKSQNVFNSGDPVVNYNGSAALGSASNPNISAHATMYKWVRTTTGSITWNTTKYKAYLWEDANGGKMAFRLRYPDNYDSTKLYPLMLFLHGGGEIGPITDNELHLLWGAQTFQSMVDAGQWNGFILYPQETGIDWGANALAFIPPMLDTLQKYKGFDPDRLITVGLSEGGLGDLVFSSLYPQRVATCIPSSPVQIFSAPSSTPFPNMIHIPIWMANGGTDTGPDPLHAADYADTVRALGGYCVQQFYPKGDHGIWTNHWGQLDINNNSLLAQYLNSAHKAQPLLYFQQNLFCQGSPISARMGVTPGFYTYQWQLNGVDIPGATGNEYTATQTGSYRVHFKRLVTSDWSAWTPNPIKIATKPCSLDTLFAEHFSYNSPLPYDYQYNAPSGEYKRYNFNCMNGVYTTGLDNFTQDATGKVGGRFSLNYTYGNSGCTYTAGDKVWGTYQNYPVVTPGTNYLFSFYAGNQTNTTPLASLGARIDGTILTQISKPSGLNSNLFGNNSWQKLSFLWNSGGNTGADLVILNNNLNTNGNDFVLDEISFTKLLAPGGFGSNMMLWSKADAEPQADSTRMNDWANSSGSTELVQITPVSQPLLKNNPSDNINFNPLVNFSAANAWSMNAPSGFAGTATHNAAHMFIVARTVDSSSADSLLIERGNSSTNRVAVVMNMKNNVVWDAGSTSGASHLTLAGQRSDLNKPILWTFSKDNTNGTGSGGGNKQDIRKNGVVVASTTTAGTAFTGSNQSFKMGLSNTKVAEVIYYLDANINAARQNRIESYLATKYGMTLGTAAAPISYTASDSSTVFWPASTTYQNDVFGIGVDSLSGLNQLISNSINSGSGDGTGQAGKGNLILTAIAPLGDKDFVMIGNDANVLTEHPIAPLEAPAVVQGVTRVGREWKVKNTGNVGSVTLTFDTTGLTLAGGSTLANYILMVDSDGDGDFTTGTVSFFYATSSAGKQINFSGITFNDGVDFTILTQKPASSLPETWLGFTAQNINGNGVLNWQTSQEINVDYYAVEHSTNGLDFTVIGVNPANNSLGINNYTYTQQSLSAGMHYYRIRAVDRDGVFKYSDVRSIKVSALNAIQIRPNPVSGSTLTLGISLQQNAQAVIQVVSIDGKVMMRMNTQLTQGINTVNLNVDAIPTGIYLVQVQMNNDAVTKKFIRTR